MDLATGKYRRVSPGVGKTTCGYFRPDGKKIIFASSHLDPDAKKQLRRRVQAARGGRKPSKRRRYGWDFDPYMDIFEANPDGTGLKQLTDAKGYDAEGTYSPDGKQIVFCSNRGGAKNLELYIMDADGKNVRQLTNAPQLLQRRPVLLARRQAGHLPQRPQEEGPPAALRHQRRRHRRAGPDRRPELGLLGAVLVQGRQAHHLHRPPTTATRRCGQLRPLLDERRHRQEGAASRYAPAPTCCRCSAPTARR